MTSGSASTPLAPYSSFKVLSFDINGTLLNCDATIYKLLLPLVQHLPASDPLRSPFPPKPEPGSTLAKPHPLLAAFDVYQFGLWVDSPTMVFEDLLKKAYADTAAELGTTAKPEDAEALATSMGDWAPFPDTVAALQQLGKHYKLVGLTNNSAVGVDAVVRGPLRDVHFDRIFTAEEIGSYKPSLNNYRYMYNGIREQFGVEPDQVIHIAHGYATDMVRSKELGNAHVWVSRGVDNWSEPRLADRPKFAYVATMGQLVEEMEKQGMTFS